MVLRLSTGHSSRQAREPWSRTPKAGLESPPAPGTQVQSSAQITLRGSDRGLRRLISRRMRSTSSPRSRRAPATKVLPTVMARRSWWSRLKVWAIRRHPASGIRALSRSDFVAHPRRLRWLEAVNGSRKRLGGRGARPRTPSLSGGADVAMTSGAAKLSRSRMKTRRSKVMIRRVCLQESGGASDDSRTVPASRSLRCRGTGGFDHGEPAIQRQGADGPDHRSPGGGQLLRRDPRASWPSPA